MAILEKTVDSVGAVLAWPLTLPTYQRPYKWQNHHVHRLLDDLLDWRQRLAPQDGQRYRLGTVVLHREGTRLFVVDGQQRLLTLTMLCHLLDVDEAPSQLLAARFHAAASVDNLRHAAALLRGRLGDLAPTDREALLQFVRTRCELVCVVLDDIAEAFQFFDAQNARGVPLQPHDLLKAYHLRACAAHDDCAPRVARWEARVNPVQGEPDLRVLMGEVLFCLRRWIDARSAFHFTRADIDVFKGLTLRDACHPLAVPAQRLAAMDAPYPFQLGQVMLNGLPFFDYVEHYAQLYARLFVARHPAIAPLLDLLDSYPGRHRTGDVYVRRLFSCAVLLYADRFGDDQLGRAATLCFLWAYRLRLLQARVGLPAIDAAARAPDGLLAIIARALHPHLVLQTSLPALEEQRIVASKVAPLVEHFRHWNKIA